MYHKTVLHHRNKSHTYSLKTKDHQFDHFVVTLLWWQSYQIGDSLFSVLITDNVIQYIPPWQETPCRMRHKHHLNLKTDMDGGIDIFAIYVCHVISESASDCLEAVPTTNQKLDFLSNTYFIATFAILYLCLVS